MKKLILIKKKPKLILKKKGIEPKRKDRKKYA